MRSTPSTWFHIFLCTMAFAGCSSTQTAETHQEATAGNCQLVGLSVCGTQCINFLADSSNCGGCGNVCPGGTVCGPAATPQPGRTTDEGSSFNTVAATLYGTPVAIPSPITITGFGFFPRATLGHVKLGLYADSAGRPGALVVHSASTTVAAGRQTMASTVPVDVAAGNYWIAFETDSALGVGAGVGTAPLASRRFTSYTTSMPASFGTATVNNGAQDLDLFLVAPPHGVCSETCAAGYMACSSGGNGYCANLQTDVRNCGGCGAVCPVGQQCANGACACPTGTPNACGSGTNAFCTNFQSDLNNCGACGVMCAAGQMCSPSGCVETCATGFTACGGGAGSYCARLGNDDNNCGSCGNVCPAGQDCVSGGCACPSATPNACGSGASGFCTSFTTDPNNCGACGTACGAGQICSTHGCVAVTGPTLSLSVSSGHPGITVTASVAGFQANEYVYLYYNNGTYVGYCTASSAGSCTGTFSVPYYDPAGSYVVRATGQTSMATATTTFNQNASFVTLSLTAGAPGTTNTAYAYGYAANEYVYFYYNGSYVGYCSTGGNGYCSGTFQTPYYQPQATYTFQANGQTSGLTASTPFNQNAAWISLLNTSGAPGSSNTAYAYGYAAGEYVYFYYAGTYVGYCSTNAQGYCSGTFSVPYYDVTGTYSVSGNGQTSGLTASASFAQNAATFSLLSTSGAPGSNDTAYAYGYASGEYVYFYYAGTYVGYCSANAQGYCSGTFSVPYYDPTGSYSVSGNGQTSGISATTSFNQNAVVLNLATTSGAAGSSDTAYLYGFAASETVRITFDGSQVGTCVAAGNGYCSTAFTIPAAASGSHTVAATGATTSLSSSTSFSVTP